jgi:hypothetical protein
MPRAATQTQFHRYQLLNDSYFGDDRPLSYLGRIPQSELYEFYQHHVEGHTVESLREHQDKLRHEDPSLANRAGKHFRQFVILTKMLEDRRQEQIRIHGKKKWVPPAQRQIAVNPVFLPNPDFRKLSMALLELVKQNRRDRYDMDASEPDAS